MIDLESFLFGFWIGCLVTAAIVVYWKIRQIDKTTKEDGGAQP